LPLLRKNQILSNRWPLIDPRHFSHLVCEFRLRLPRCISRRPSGADKSRHKVKIPELYDQSALVSVHEMVNFRLADRLLKGDAGEHSRVAVVSSRRAVRSAENFSGPTTPSALIIWRDPPRLRLQPLASIGRSDGRIPFQQGRRF
jgi:hypothetical protein